MRYLLGLICVLAVAAAACGEKSIPCEYERDCPPPEDECLYETCLAGFCRYFAYQHGAGCELSDGSMGVCEADPHTFSPDSPGCVRTSEPIPCVYGYNNSLRTETTALSAGYRTDGKAPVSAAYVEVSTSAKA